MAKKIVRGITDVKTINNQDLDTNNVNDLLSDGQYNYIHRKKGKSEEYHNLTDNIKTISSDNTDLLAVTNNNKTTNSATLHPKHDAQKEQVLESTRNTLNIHHGTNGTDEKTTVDTNPAKVLEHDNLQTTYGVSKSTSGNVTTLGVEYTKVADGFDLNNFFNGCVKSDRFTNSPKDNAWFFVRAYYDGNYAIQDAVALTLGGNNRTFRRLRYDGVWGAWREQVTDKSTLDNLLAQKQNTLTAFGGISITGNSITLKTIDRYEGDLNNLTNTCLAKPIDNAPNLPTGVYGNGILTVTRIADVVSQQYHTFSNMIYYRTARYADGAPGNVPQWSPWVKVTTTALS